LKKEIEKKKKKYSLNRKGMTNLEKAQIRKEIKLKQAKLEGVNEGIEAIKKDVEDLKIKYKGQMAVKPAFNKLIKIINGVIEKIKLYEQEGI